jgi:rsbT co-antagonist protein RsbR
VANPVVDDILAVHETALLEAWWRQLSATGVRRDLMMNEAELREQCADFFRLLRSALQESGSTQVQGEPWTPVKEMLSRISRSRGLQGFTPTETASVVFSLKQPLYEQLQRASPEGGRRLAEAFWAVSTVLDQLGLFTTEVHQKAREEVIIRQQQEMMELSTPVVELWKGIVALPLIGTLDSGRTQTVMETLLERIVEKEAEVAIIDITGVPTVDTLTAQHLLKTVTATRLMGAECIISGVRPQIAQTIVHLGVDLGDVLTKATLASAFQLALQRRGVSLRAGLLERQKA